MDEPEAIAVVLGVEQRQLLTAVDPVGGFVEIEHDARRHRSDAAANRSINPSPLRPSSRHDRAFSRRDKVA